MKKTLLIISVAMLFIIGTIGCKKDIKVSSVTLDKTNITLEVGETADLTATVHPGDATNKVVTWASSNPTIATAVLGKITAIKVGTATITVTTSDGGYTAECVVTVTEPDLGDPGVVFNGIKWATCNVDAPGTFAATPQDLGMLYQWNRKNGWAATGTVSGWDSSYPEGNSWEKVNDPCPSGWRVPTKSELESLRSISNQWTTQNGVKGRIFGSGMDDKTLFLPAVGDRHMTTGLLYSQGDFGYYWSSTAAMPNMPNGAHHLAFNSVDNAGMGGTLRSSGNSVRCVAE